MFVNVTFQVFVNINVVRDAEIRARRGFFPFIEPVGIATSLGITISRLTSVAYIYWYKRVFVGIRQPQKLNSINSLQIL